LDQDHARDLLQRVGVLRHPCDLDLLVFFARHPRTLMTSEQLAALTGYGLQQTAESLDVLLKAELITRTHTPTRAARMYVLAAHTNEERLAPLLAFASTRQGRLALRELLARASAGRSGDRTAPARDDASEGTRPFLVRRRAEPLPERRVEDRRRGGS